MRLQLLTDERHERGVQRGNQRADLGRCVGVLLRAPTVLVHEVQDPLDERVDGGAVVHGLLGGDARQRDARDEADKLGRLSFE